MQKSAKIFIIFFIGINFIFSIPQISAAGNAAQKPRAHSMYDLRFGLNIGPGSALHLAAQKFAREIGRKTNNRVKITVYANQELGDDHQMVEMARNGELDIVLTPTAKLGTLIPSMQFADLPFLFPTPEDAYEILDGEVGRLLLEQMNSYGLCGAAIWENGFKQFTANFPISEPADFKGLKIRIMKSRIISEQFRAMGAIPIPIDFHSTYQALKDKVVDGQENPLVAIVKMKFHEVQPYLTISNHSYLGYILYFSKAVFDRLPQDIQKILMETAKELTSFEREETRKREQEFLKIIKESGTKIYELTDEQRQKFKKVTANIIEEYKSVIGADIIDKALSFLQKKYGITQEKEIIIGINADMSLGGAIAGESIKRGVKLAVSEINREGGLLGMPVRVVVKDHSSVPARGIANIKILNKLDNLLAIVGGMHSPVIIASHKIIHDNKIIYLAPWSSATPVAHNEYKPNYVFRVSVCDMIAGNFMVDQAVKKSDRVAFLMGNTDWGRSNLEAMSKALKKIGLEPVAVERFNWGDTDMTLQLTRIEKQNPGVILTALNAPEGIGLIRTMKRRNTIIPVISHWGITGGNFFEPVKKELENIPFQFIQSFSFFNELTPRAEKLMHNYYKTYSISSPEQIPAPVGTAHAYDLIHLLAEAVKIAGSLERPAVRTALEKIKYFEGAVKTYSQPFTADSHDALGPKDFFMAEYDNNGIVKPIKNNKK